MKLSFALVAVVSVIAAAPAIAATTTSTLNVAATVVDSCTAGGATLNFGQFDPRTGSALTGNQNFTVQCTVGTDYTIALNAGTGDGASLAIRKMTGTNTSELLNYALFVDSGRTVIWGDGTDTTEMVSSDGTGSNQVFTVYGTILGGQTATPVDTYSDAVTITVTY
ncbi:Csu type fimbrial protein [Tahibacter amnicola]|uniref:Spore coat U domain-containing protein n=1 Tax=Tahibacter amnicola TaxID=2976241 RepID=A0ABY6BB80_9GAMM|nr:spore coat U domain-containing protein [Tahibacter amnicola]UXI67313.1 spore coat U domain-containing protein [Tahibacter amnicola]